MPKTNLTLFFSRNYVFLLEKINLAPNLLIITINVGRKIMWAKKLSYKNKIKGGDNQVGESYKVNSWSGESNLSFARDETLPLGQKLILFGN